MTGHFFIYNDTFYAAGTPVISSGNRSLRYGDGLFETMKILHGKIINKEYHFERLFHGLHVLQFETPKLFTHHFFEKKIAALVAKNKHANAASIRLMLFRSNGGIFDVSSHKPAYIIESFEINEQLCLNENGLTVDIFPEARKSADAFCNIKTNNYLPYAMAGIFAKKNKLNDCIILNSFERICDSAIANIFIVKNNIAYTPPLSEACVAGVTRRWLLETGKENIFTFIEKILTIEDLLSADEIFLTNSIYHIRWVKNFRNIVYKNTFTKELYHQLIKTI